MMQANTKLNVIGIVDIGSLNNCNTIFNLLSLRFTKENSRFISVFYKLMNGDATSEEKEFTIQYAKDFIA